MSSHSSQGATQHRQNYIEWDQYFMGIALLAGQRSKDPYFPVGACIINNDNQIVGVGYNGMPTGINDNVLPWGKGNTWEGSVLLDSKSYYVCHAELNAIIFKSSADVKGCTMYTTQFPCNECAKVIIQSRIAKVICFSVGKIKDKDKYKAAKTMLQEAGVVLEEYQGSRTTIELMFPTDNLGA